MNAVSAQAPRRPPLRYHGGKWRLAPWIIQHFPPHRRYVEAFGGGAGVLLRKERSHSEIYNDLDGEVCRFFRVLRDPEQRERLVESVTFTPFSREEFDRAYEPTTNDVEAARRMLVRSHMGFGSAAATHVHRTGCRIGVVRSRTTPAQDWRGLPPVLRAVGERFMGVDIETRPATRLLSRWGDDPETLFYLDPPYLRSTRSTDGPCYQHEMSEDDHRTLGEAVADCAAAVVISGYACSLYDDDLFSGWHRVERATHGNGQSGASRRVEVLWLNEAAVDGLHAQAEAEQEAARGPLFDLNAIGGGR